ncbi:MAG: Na+/H+ antiporter NhaC family protein [Muricomes sp.]|uniref:Na+/H+ antiporter NhaC family protein n=1 Tax=Faecalicatena contorta TaxID=39482 RepID=UPI002EC6D2FB|nr:Na+/H+ antiporter NhaC family protein [Muricomes sp.]
MEEKKKRKLSRVQAGILFLLMMVILGGGSGFFGFELKMMVLIVVVILLLVGKYVGLTMGEMIDAYALKIRNMAPIFLILLGIGYLISGFMMGGTIPGLVSWLTNLISPSMILLLSFVLVSILSAMIGSSFASIGTLGIIMFSVAIVQGVPVGLAGAAVICGANFGGIISPFNDNMNATPALYGMSSFEMIRKLILPVGIATVISVIYYAVKGLPYAGEGGSLQREAITTLVNSVEELFNVNPIVILPLVLALVLAVLKIDIIINLYVSGTVGMFLGVFLQGFSFKNCINSLYSGFSSDTFFAGKELPDSMRTLLNRGGMYSMADPICFLLIMFFMVSLLNQVGVFTVIQEMVFSNIKNPGLLTLVSTLSCWILMLVTLDGMPTGVVSKDMLENVYIRSGYDPRKVARIACASANWLGNWLPWAFCANYYASVCGIEIWECLPYMIFLPLPSIIIVILSFFGIGNEKLLEAKTAGN